MRPESKRFKRTFTFAFTGVAVLAAILCANPVSAQPLNSYCGSLTNGYGPYDYRTDQDKLPIVLTTHFTPEVEALIKGHTTAAPGGDIDYTLRAIPNNHRALMAMAKLGEKEKTNQPRESRYTIECWFERAVSFRPDDGVVRMIYSTYLNGRGRNADATKQLQLATAYAKDNPFTHYNIGLHYFDMKAYDRALIQAHKAIALGFTRMELRDKLQTLGKWTEPATLPDTASSDTAPVDPIK